MATKERLLANKKYNAANYDEIKLRVHKGKKEELQSHAELRGESLNGFILRAIRETMARDIQRGQNSQDEKIVFTTRV